jgi:hypothetical protein
MNRKEASASDNNETNVDEKVSEPSTRNNGGGYFPSA